MRMWIKKLAYAVFLACIVPVTAFGVMAYTPSRPCDVVMNSVPTYPDTRPMGQVDAYYNYNEPQQDYEETGGTDWYLSTFITSNMWSWENKYESDYFDVIKSFDSDKYSFETVWGGSVALGLNFDENVRGDIEVGMSTKFSDADESIRFSMSLPYVMANLHRDFENGMYLSAGAGAARTTMKLNGAFFDNMGAKKTVLSPKISAAIGYSASISDSTYFDLRYRLSGIRGASISNNRFEWNYDVDAYEKYFLHVKGSWVIENSFLAGLRFNF